MAIRYASELRPGGNFPLVDSKYIKGGVKTVQTLSELLKIPDSFLTEGTICYVSDKKEYYKYANKTWGKLTIAGGGGSTGGDGIGIPILDLEKLDELGSDLPNKYITIPDKINDLNGFNLSREIQSSGTYVDILFLAIRTLLSEVARLSNAFKYGINSYTEKNTAMSAINTEIVNPDEEPLWAIEESDLSQLDEITIGQGSLLIPVESVNSTNEGLLIITGATSIKEFNVFLDVEDPKIFAYITASNLNIVINLKSTNSEVNIDLSKLNLPVVDKYNILFLVNRLENNNYIWMSITNPINNHILKEGYYKDNNLFTSKQNLLASYIINNILFTDLILYKCAFYSKYLDFSHEVKPSIPQVEDYKYSVAHITIRSVSTEDVLKNILSQLPDNELIWCETSKKLFIKSKGQTFAIGSNGGSIDGGDDNMITTADLIAKLKELGINVNDDLTKISIDNLADITFIHEASHKKFKFLIDSKGNLYSREVSNDTLTKRINDAKVELKDDIRGVIGQLRMKEHTNTGQLPYLKRGSDAKIYADRIKIGCVYMPFDTLKVHGCSHAFVELENTADCDFALEGCYLHYTYPNELGQQLVEHLALTGIIPAGGTYLIRGKLYANFEDANTYIKVDSFDLEWAIGSNLIDFTIHPKYVGKYNGYGLAITYGQPTLSYDETLYYPNKVLDNEIPAKDFEYFYKEYFIDALYFYAKASSTSESGYWAGIIALITENSLYRNVFELDPAKLAFQSLNKKDSSRRRWQKSDDIQIVDLNKEFIEFPKTEDKRPVSDYTPKASYLHKTVISDKTQLDKNRPNMVTSSFGIDIYRTRCFNWVSSGLFDEFIWIKKEGESTWKKFESYKTVTEPLQESSEYPRRREFQSIDIINNIYSRIVGRFPGCGEIYTSHKVILDLTAAPVAVPTKYIYVCGRQDKNGNPDPLHTSEEYSVTLYPDTYTPRIYQITDLQGFTWIQYQVWAAAAHLVALKIEKDKSNNIIPIVINTGDMTLNGTRLNEWIDYYQAGKELFKLYEQMNVVGNNDLCGTNINILGTGDDDGKSNSFYFHVFYCYEINPEIFIPIVNNKYIPSLYYFDSKNHRFIMVNSEITDINCDKWFGLHYDEGPIHKIINLYTGFTIGEDKYNTTINGSDSGTPFVTIYTMVYNMLNTSHQKKVIAVCHEMPFTVITEKSILSDQKGKFRSFSDGTPSKLIGSHLNQISPEDIKKGLYWFSRLLEHFKVPLCIGGHKHTYACTYPLRENYLYGSGLNSKDNGPMPMESTLKNDNITWVKDSKNLSKFPLTKREFLTPIDSSKFYPYESCTDLTGGVIYFMCLATGFKLASNKELPTNNLKFSYLLPETTSDNKPDDNLKYPMFGIILLEGSQIRIELARIKNIFTSTFKFALNVFGIDKASLDWATAALDNNYGTWVADTDDYHNELVLLTIE